MYARLLGCGVYRGVQLIFYLVYTAADGTEKLFGNKYDPSCPLSLILSTSLTDQADLICYFTIGCSFSCYYNNSVGCGFSLFSGLAWLISTFVAFYCDWWLSLLFGVCSLFGRVGCIFPSNHGNSCCWVRVPCVRIVLYERVVVYTFFFFF